jgi:hypothetical protein
MHKVVIPAKAGTQLLPWHREESSGDGSPPSGPQPEVYPEQVEGRG